MRGFESSPGVVWAATGVCLDCFGVDFGACGWMLVGGLVIGKDVSMVLARGASTGDHGDGEWRWCWGDVRCDGGRNDGFARVVCVGWRGGGGFGIWSNSLCALTSGVAVLIVVVVDNYC